MNDKIKWTIIQNTHSLRYYPFKRIDHTVLASIEDAMKQRKFVKHQREKSFTTLKLFECFLQVTDNRLCLLDLSHPKFTQIAQAFVGAIWSKLFIRVSIERSYNLTLVFQNILKTLQIVIPAITIPKIYFSSHYITDDISNCIKQFKLIFLMEIEYIIDMDGGLITKITPLGLFHSRMFMSTMGMHLLSVSLIRLILLSLVAGRNQ